jgi:hypothetical protein
LKILALTGEAGHGKDTAALLIADAWVKQGRGHVVCRAFADALRTEVIAAYGIDYRLLSDPETKETKTPLLALNRCNDQKFVKAANGFELATVNEEPLTPRTVMQLWGTEYRRTDDPDYWVNRMDELITATKTAYPPVTLFIITDCRFPNEADFIRRMRGQIWRISRPGYKKPGWTSAHISERGQKAITSDCTFSNTLIEDLRMQLIDSISDL